MHFRESFVFVFFLKLLSACFAALQRSSLPSRVLRKEICDIDGLGDKLIRSDL